MKITKKVFESFDSCISGKPPETGGIIGSADHKTVTDIIFDKPKGNSFAHICSYYPNVDFLNKSIEEWDNKGVSFVGLFHTHFANVKTLSLADKKYILSIMNVMPKKITKLFFPIYVLPARELVCYCASKHNDDIVIYTEDIEII